jgi:beta-glucosidase
VNRTQPALKVPSGKEFLWATGIEDTFIVEPHRKTGRTLDEYELTEHYDRWEEDLRLMAELGVSAARYGIPWHRVCTQPGKYDWSWTDRVLDRMVNSHRIEPIVDLVHYGAPLWMERSFDDPDYPQHVADYARAFADHYKGLVTWYTPLNEPRVNAWYAGRLGWWPPYGRSWRAFVRVLLQLCRGICLTQRAIEEVEPEAVLVHVDATDLYLPHDTGDELAADEARKRQSIVFLALDLVMGRVGSDHALYRWLASHGVGEAYLEWFRENSVRPHVIGYNMYPMFSRKVVRRARNGRLQVKIERCWTETLVELTRMYAARYASIPLMVTETASSGRISKRVKWIEDSTAAILAAREEGLPVVGYTFWPLFSLVTWAYRNGSKDESDYLLHMGLWDLRPGRGGLERVPTPAVDMYKRVVAAGPGSQDAAKNRP